MDRKRVTDHVQQVADGMEKGGAGVAVGSWIASGVSYLDHHAQAVLAVCGIVGMLVGVVGLLLKWAYMRVENRRLEREHKARMRVLRGGGKV